jgi:hypothetical protein
MDAYRFSNKPKANSFFILVELLIQPFDSFLKFARARKWKSVG